ncbi:glycosyltransferase family 31 protein [Ophiocordyceps camponoti-floridani]|uniref:N-acetylgalactosaminide beta-1,3-galactosyltransferase n=1 Tax=Ophiocordyceps camponoti-floridani TaxID=2030778 RepID=A0A8H4Q403_9HYPO|nr:glycosyltransferase family 31 protein [Ophiocordyceps camponoti-floridani]
MLALPLPLPKRRVIIAGLVVFGLLLACFRLAARCDDRYCALLLPSSAASRQSASGSQAHAAAEDHHVSRLRAGDECAGFPDTSSVLLVMKTGASEAFARIPNQVLTDLTCLSDYLFFGDMEMTVAGLEVHDSLADVVSDVKLSNKDFDIYHRQRACGADLTSCNKGFDVGQEAWNLDKYKNIHMAEKTYALRPNYDWYLFVDADTYVAWPTMMSWLERLDARKRHYVGSIAYVGNFPFAHGGSGYLVSQAAMRDMYRGREGVGRGWDDFITKQCCGDFAFSYALHNETGIDVQGAWPTVNGEKPFTIPFSERSWCHPIVTMHHLQPEEVSDLWAWERERAFAHPLRIRDVFHRFVEDKLLAFREDWDNMSDSAHYLNASAYSYSDSELESAKSDNLSALELVAHRSFDDCRRACQSLDKCMQYHFRNGICSIGHSIRHGKPVQPEKEEHKAQWQHRSGWMVKRIQDWVATNDECRGVEWPVKDTWLS